MQTILALLVLLLLVLPIPASAIEIHATFDPDFTNSDRAVIDEAIQAWLVFFTCGHTIAIHFALNNDLEALGETGNWNFNAAGLPTSPQVTIDYDAHNWTIDAPAAGQNDAFDTLAHEIGHALGFTTVGDLFAAHVVTVAGNRFFDGDNNGVFDLSNFNLDFDLDDNDAAGTHARPGSGDLMEPEATLGERHFPTVSHAMVLEHAYGYARPVPEPSTVLLFAGGFIAMITCRAKARRWLNRLM